MLIVRDMVFGLMFVVILAAVAWRISSEFSTRQENPPAIAPPVVSETEDQQANQTKQTENEWTKTIQSTEAEFAGYVFDQPIWDRSRPDLLGPKEVIEVDWSYKWKEGVGQACYYQAAAQRPATVLLLFPEGIESEKSRLYAYRALVACSEAGIKLRLYDCKNQKFMN